MQWKEKTAKFWKEWLKPILVILLITSAVRSAMADWNDVPTGSMKPTIMEGDRVFINKLAYDLKVPFTTVHIAEWDNPKRGEIVVFFSPHDGKRLVKRVVGLPGDSIEMRNNEVWINGSRAEYKPLDPQITNEIPAGEQPLHHFYSEDLTGRNHAVMVTPGSWTIRSFPAFQVPEHQYFMMGDNRDNSFDSRYFGTVGRDLIVGRAVAVVLSVNPEHYYMPRWHRFFTSLY